MQLNSAKDLNVYKKSYQLAMMIFDISKSFPADEKFALTGQIKFFALRRQARKVSVIVKPIDCSGDALFHQGLPKIEEKSELVSRKT